MLTVTEYLGIQIHKKVRPASVPAVPITISTQWRTQSTVRWEIAVLNVLQPLSQAAFNGVFVAVGLGG